MFYMFIEILLIQEIKLLTEKTEETVRLWYVFKRGSRGAACAAKSLRWRV